MTCIFSFNFFFNFFFDYFFTVFYFNICIIYLQLFSGQEITNSLTFFREGDIKYTIQEVVSAMREPGRFTIF